MCVYVSVSAVCTSICRHSNLVSPTNRLSTLSLLFFRFIYHMAPQTYTTYVRRKKIIKNLYSIHIWMYACMYECLFVCTYILCMCIYPYVFLTKCELSALPTTTTNELRARGWLAVNWSAAVATADAMVNEFNEVTSGTRQQLFALPDRKMSFQLPRAINV